MYSRLGSALVIFLISSGAALSADEPQPSTPSTGLFQGTPEEQAACNPDATKFCRDAMPDTFRVLACLQEHRKRISKACLQVLESHGK